MFAARSRGDSMEPKISDGMWCLSIPMSLGRGMIVLSWWKIKAKSAVIVTP
jgi:hypothetical protein